MTRITNAIKDSIVKNALLKSGVTARIEVVEEKRFEWAERARIESIGGTEKAAEYAKINQQSRAAYETLPQGLKDNAYIVERRGSLYLNLAGASLTVRLKGIAEASSNREVISADSKLCQQFYDIESEEQAACDQGTVIENQVRATLDKFGTVKRLIAAWPEVAELMPPEVASTKSNLPAIKVADLNNLVGLTGASK